MRRALALVTAAVLAACSSTVPTTTTDPWYASTSTPATTTPKPATPTTRPPADTDLRLTVYLDGWSKRILDGVDLYLVTRDSLIGDYLEFKPLTPPEITQLLSTQPDWVAKVLARMAATDFDWSCSESGCVTAAGEYSASDVSLWLTDPANIPGYGVSYEGWDVSAGVWAAEVWVDASADALEVFGVAGGEKMDVASAAWSSQVSTVEIGSLAPSEVSDEGLGLLLAAGLGRIFPLEPAWVSSAAPYNPTLFGGFSSSEPGYRSSASDVDARLLEAAARGLADPSASQVLRTLPANELTYLTSPSVGCAPFVTCIPATADVALEVSSAEKLQVCVAAEALPFEPSEGERFTAEAMFTRFTRSLTLDAPAHLNGVWGGVGPEDFEAPYVAGGHLLPLPPLASGDVELESFSFNIYAKDFLDSPEVLWTQVSRVVQVGVDPDANWTAADLVAPLSAVSLCD